MRVAYLTAGAAGMLCGSCLHDNTLAAALGRMGHDVALLPTYTPIRTDESDVSTGTIFYGAVNLYLQQKSAFFRHTPRFVDRLLDHPALLNWASRRGTASNAAQVLGPLTCSMLAGEDGSQRKELHRLVAWLRDELRPEIVHLTNSMFLGMAGPIRRALGVPVLCSVQGEDLFLDNLPAEWRGRVVSLMREKARDADAILATEQEYAERMAALLDLPLDRFRVVPLGISLEGHGPGPAARPGAAPGAPFTIGYLARICPEKGLHLVVEALRLLSSRPGGAAIRLEAAGYLGERDRPYFDEITRRLQRDGLADRFRYLGEVDRAGKLAFLGSIDILSVAPTFKEPKGLYALEAMASGVPTLLPDHGAFPEMLRATGGGALFTAGSASALADAIDTLRRDPARRLEMGRIGRERVHAHFSDRVMAERTLSVYLEARSAQPAIRSHSA